MLMGGSAGLLLSAVAGYWVLERADRHKGRLRTLGQALGGVILVVSLVGLACRVWCVSQGAGGWCGMKAKGGMCPLTHMKGGMTQP